MRLICPIISKQFSHLLVCSWLRQIYPHNWPASVSADQVVAESRGPGLVTRIAASIFPDMFLSLGLVTVFSFLIIS